MLCVAPVLALEGWHLMAGMLFGSRRLAVFGGAMMLASAFVIFVQALRTRRREHIAAVLPEGLMLRPAGLPEKMIPWHALAVPVQVTAGPGIELPIRDSSRTHFIGHVFNRIDDAQRFAAQIEMRIVETERRRGTPDDLPGSQPRSEDV